MVTKHDCTEEIKQVALKVTPARVETLRLFESHDKPMDAAHLINHLHQKLGIDRVTVFRILNIFAEKGLIRKLEFGEGKARYEVASNSDHHHLVCEFCGSIQDFKDTIVPKMEQAIALEHGFLIKGHSLEFFGVCKKCLKKTVH